MTMAMIRFLQGLVLPERKLEDDSFADAQAAAAATAAAAAGPLLTSRSAFAQSPCREDAFWSPGNWGGMQEGLSTLLPMQADLFKRQAMSPDSALGFGGGLGFSGGDGGGGGWFEDLGVRLGGVGKVSSPPQHDKKKDETSPPSRPPAPSSGEGQEGALTSRKQARRASAGIFSMFGSAETPRAGGGGEGGDVLAGIGAGFAGLGHGVFSVIGGGGRSEHERPAAGNSRQQIRGAGGSSSEAVRSRPPSARDIGRGNVSARSGVSRQNAARSSARGSAGAEGGRRQSSSARRK